MKDTLYEAIFRAAEALEIPVILLSIAALAWVLVEIGALVAEVARRLRRRRPAIEEAALEARRLVRDGEPRKAAAALEPVAWSSAMRSVLRDLPATVRRADADSVVAKMLADFEFGRERRLARTRLLVRFGPALGLMGTLIPLSPALEGLANGDVATLAENLRLAFSVTVLGLLIGAAAFAVSLLRDRTYGQDYSDLEFVAALLTAPGPLDEGDVGGEGEGTAAVHPVRRAAS